MCQKCLILFALIGLSPFLFGGVGGGSGGVQINSISNDNDVTDPADAVLGKDDIYSYLFAFSTLNACEIVYADETQVLINVPESILEDLIKSGVSSGDKILLEDCILQGEWEVISLSETNY